MLCRVDSLESYRYPLQSERIIMHANKDIDPKPFLNFYYNDRNPYGNMILIPLEFHWNQSTPPYSTD